MTKAEILALVQKVARDEADADTISDYFDEVMEELGRDEHAPFVSLANQSLTSGVGSYTLRTDGMKLLYVFYDGYQLSKVSEHEIEAYSTTWREETGTPVAWKEDLESPRQFRLYPTPDATSTTRCKVVFTDNRAVHTTTIYTYTALYITFRILYKELMRPSDHQDVAWARLLQQVAQLFYTLSIRRRRDEKGIM